MTSAADEPFWKRKRLDQLNREEWESLCDGCGKCCLLKLIDEDTEELHFTDVACRLLDCETCRCGDYANRQERVSDCVVLSPEEVAENPWMPSSCAYRLLEEGKDLPWWHHLVSGSRATIHLAGASVRGRILDEDDIPEERLPERIVDWPA